MSIRLYPVGKALSRLVLGVHLFSVGTMRGDQYVDLTEDKLLWLIDISALSGP